MMVDTVKALRRKFVLLEYFVAANREQIQLCEMSRGLIVLKK
jgi:hypothetical protein